MRASVRDLEEARRIILKGLEDHPASVYLFGSWARNEARRYSDIDVAISSPEPLPPGLLLEIEEALDQSEVLYPVELVDLTTASESLRERVAAEGIPWNA
jgi:predicted nucleotidyltransferase